MMDQKIKGKTKFTACAYRPYSPNFDAPIGPPTIPGPTIECEIGDTVVVNFQNKVDSPVTMHPHGIFYPQEMDGAYKGRYTDPGGFVQKKQIFQYVWEAAPGTEGSWLYHDHGPMEPMPVYKGLFGPLIVRPTGATPANREFFIAFHSFSPPATGLSTALLLHQRPRLRRQHADARGERRRERRLPRLRDRQRLPHLPHPRPSLGRRIGDRGRQQDARTGRLVHGRRSPRTTRAAGSTTATCSPICTQGMNGWYIVN